MYKPAPSTHSQCVVASSSAGPTKVPYVGEPNNKISVKTYNWDVVQTDYKPIEYTTKKVLESSVSDVHVDKVEFKSINFNEFDVASGHDRTSAHGIYDMMYYSDSMRIFVPQNPVGCTGTIGRGRLRRWGPNKAADMILTRSTDNNGFEFIAIRRKDTKKLEQSTSVPMYAIPGGMVDIGEDTYTTAIREIFEEALADKQPKFLESVGKYTPEFIRTERNKSFETMFGKAELIYSGYVDDPRNTDNAWMESDVYHLHVRGDNKDFEVIQAGDDAASVEIVRYRDGLKMYASHGDFMKLVSERIKSMTKSQL